jgi:hypothetical protein
MPEPIMSEPIMSEPVMPWPCRSSSELVCGAGAASAAGAPLG